MVNYNAGIFLKKRRQPNDKDYLRQYSNFTIFRCAADTYIMERKKFEVRAGIEPAFSVLQTDA